MQNENSDRYRKFMAENSSTLLGRTILKIQSSHERDVKYHEITITISQRAHKKYGKIFFASPEVQQRVISNYMKEQCNKRGISLLGMFEYHANGNKHLHAIVKHETGYQSHLRKFQHWCKRNIGNSRMTQIRNMEKYIGYILKEYEPGNELIVGFNVVHKPITDWLEPARMKRLSTLQEVILNNLTELAIDG